jgi:hypothetical protein
LLLVAVVVVIGILQEWEACPLHMLAAMEGCPWEAVEIQ